MLYMRKGTDIAIINSKVTFVRRFWHNANHLLHCFCKNCDRRRFTKMWPKAKTTLGYKSFAMILYFLASSNTKEDSHTHRRRYNHTFIPTYTNTYSSIILKTYWINVRRSFAKAFNTKKMDVKYKDIFGWLSRSILDYFIKYDIKIYIWNKKYEFNSKWYYHGFWENIPANNHCCIIWNLNFIIYGKPVDRHIILIVYAILFPP